MSDLTLTSILLAAATIIAFAVVVGALFLMRRQLQALQLQQVELQLKLAALQQQHMQQQNELLAMGQRVLEADKVVRRFSARIDSMETAGPSKTQYGQLESLLAKSIEHEGGESSAETELLALLRQQQRRS